MSPLRRYRNWRNTRYLPGRCRHAGCRGKRVGLSVWCREHTDLILARKYSPDWPQRKTW